MDWMQVQFMTPWFNEATSINISNVDVLRVLLVNCVLVEWIDHAYPFGVVFLKSYFRAKNTFFKIYCNIDDEQQHQQLDVYGEPLAIPQWDG